MPARRRASATCSKIARRCCGCSRTVPRVPRRGGRQLSRPLLATMKSVAPPAATATGMRRADAGAFQFGLLRAQLPRAIRWGSSWSRRPIWWSTTNRLDADDRGAREGRRDLSPDRRRLSRSAGVPPRFGARRARADRGLCAGNVAIINAPGNGIADDKAIYSYMPEIVRFYTGGEPKLPNVQTCRCREPRGAAIHARSSRRAGGEAGRRIGRLRHAGRADRRSKAEIEASAPR